MSDITPTKFKEVFLSAFRVNLEKIHWDSATRRTTFMQAYIYPAISAYFPGVEFEYEHDKIDAVLYKPSEIGAKPTNENILVAIEHENTVGSIGAELSVFKNLALKDVLKVLITYTGNIKEYIVKRQLDSMKDLKENFLLILYPEKREVNQHPYGEKIGWGFYTRENFHELCNSSSKQTDT